MNKLSNILSVFTCDGRANQEYINATARAAERSKRLLELDRAVVCSPIMPEVTDIKWYEIPILDGIKAYSDWIIQRSHEYVCTDFVLFTQSDGFVLNPEVWTDEFLQYDYIGAPWPAFWPQNGTYRVGNGGFSLRSKRLLGECAELDISNIEQDAEDYIISVLFRDVLESRGMRFAPVELAARFSVENYIEDFDIFQNPSLGFHGKANAVTRSFLKLNE